MNLHVGFTGAREGDLILGVGDAKDALIRVHSGTVYGAEYYKKKETVSDQEIKESVSKLFKCSHVEAERRISDFPIITVDHFPIGAGCSHNVIEKCDCESHATLVIISQGMLQKWADMYGNGEKLNSMVLNQTPVTWRDILGLVHKEGQPGGKTLLMRVSNFERVIGPAPVSESNPLFEERVEVRMECEELGPVYQFGCEVFQIPVPGIPLYEIDISEIATMVISEIEYEEFERIAGVLKVLTAGGLKSLIQKCVRFHAKEVQMIGFKVPTEAVALVATILLFKCKGSFSPELQIFTRGCTAVFRRLAVILVEDAWVKGCENKVEALLSLALVTQRLPDYHPSMETVLSACKLIVDACKSPFIISWRCPKKAQLTIESSVVPMKRAAVLLRILRSFKGDMDMMDKVAEMNGTLAVREAISKEDVMPIEHFIDQHAFRGVAHAMKDIPGSFGDRFGCLFKGCTGLNPRLALVKDIPDSYRFAQSCCLQFALKNKRIELPKLGFSVTMSVPLNSGVLAAGVGPISVRVGSKNFFVLLGLNSPVEEIVMIPPSRNAKDLFGEISSENQVKAVEIARSHKHRVKSPLIKGFATCVHTESGEPYWCLNGVRWEDVVDKGCELYLPVVESPEWIGNEFCEIEDSDIMEALSSGGEGIVVDAEEHIKELARNVEPKIGLRAVSLLKQQWDKIAMPTPDLHGNRGSDQMACYPGDWDVWKLFVVISRLVPSALRAQMLPNFSIPNPKVLRLVESWILAGVRDADSNCDENPWNLLDQWNDAMDGRRVLLPHQISAVDRMINRDKKSDSGHFLVMDTGLGKSITALRYAHNWLCDQKSKHVDYIIWVTPNGTVDNLVSQLRDTWEVPVCQIPRVSKAKNKRDCDSSSLLLREHEVNVIHADHLRTVVDEMVDKASRCFFVFDEVDEMYGQTLRTSAARLLASLCAKFVAQTATPMRKNEKELISWLRDTCDFPVDSDNFFVAASGMVSTQLDLGISTEETVEKIPMTNKVRIECRELIEMKDWMSMAKKVQRATDSAMVDIAIQFSNKDRSDNPSGGVLLVADSKAHAERLIMKCKKKGCNAGDFATMSASDAHMYAIVVVTKNMDRGYNCAIRLGVMVTGAYAGNSAARHQIRGRLKRIGQKRKHVDFVTVLMENSILDLLYTRHSRVDSMNITLDQLGCKFSSELLENLL